MSHNPPFERADRRSRTDASRRPTDRFADLQAWMLGLPWVVSGHAVDDVPHHIVIDCAPLKFRRVWVVVVSEAGRVEPDLFVVVRADLMRVVSGLDWFTGAVTLEGGQRLCRLDLGRDAATIELALLSTYAMMFPGLVDDDPA